MISIPCVKPLCNQHITHRDWRYCDLHRCRLQNCVQDKETCSKHTQKCLLKTCHERYREKKKYCQKHRCPEPTCDGVDQCSEHVRQCAVTGCARFIHKNSTYQYCRPHRCHVKSCLGNQECADHYCTGFSISTSVSKSKCGAHKLAEHGGCERHRCPECFELRSECREHCCLGCWEPTREEGSKYCIRCMCSLPGCFLWYRKCIHKCRTKGCFLRRGVDVDDDKDTIDSSRNKYCERRCYYKGEETLKESLAMLGEMEQEYEKLKEPFDFSFMKEEPRFDFKTIQSRYNEMKFLKSFKKCVERVEKREHYLPKGVEVYCIDYCSEDYCECKSGYRPSIEEEFSVVKRFQEVFGELYLLMGDGRYLLSETIKTSDGKYGWTIDKGVVEGVWKSLSGSSGSSGDWEEELYKAIQCERI